MVGNRECSGCSYNMAAGSACWVWRVWNSVVLSAVGSTFGFLALDCKLGCLLDISCFAFYYYLI